MVIGRRTSLGLSVIYWIALALTGLMLLSSTFALGAGQLTIGNWIAPLALALIAVLIIWRLLTHDRARRANPSNGLFPERLHRPRHRS